MKPTTASRPVALPVSFALLLLAAHADRAPEEREPPPAATAVPSSPAPAQQGRFDQVVVRIQPVAGRVHAAFGQGGNIGVLAGAGELLMIDTQYAPLADKIERALDGVTEAPLRFVLNTHWHPDHTGGNPHFGAQAPVVAHANVRRRLAAEPGVEGRTGENTPAVALPSVTYEDGLVLHVAGERVRLQHFPSAHTDGDTVVWFEDSKVVHLGDLCFSTGFPFIDTSSGGSVDGYFAAVRAVVDALDDDWRVIPGHGPVCGKRELAAWLGKLEDCRLLVADALESGQDAEAMKREELLKDYAELGRGFITAERFIDTLVAAAGD